MANPFEAKPTRQHDRAVPVLEAVDEPHAPIVDALPVEASRAEVVEVLPVRDTPAGLIDALPIPAQSGPLSGNPFLVAVKLTGRAVVAVLRAAVWLFGATSLMIGLAVLAALPVLQFLSLGYLLEAGGRVARTGRLRDGFIGVRKAALLGAIVLGSWLLLLPARLLAGFVHSANVIDPSGRVANGWRIGLIVLIGLTALVFVVIGLVALFVNAAFRTRGRPRGSYYAEARDAVWDLVMSLRMPYYFWLGLRGFLGAMIWLALPITLLALGRAHSPIAPLIAFFGAFLLAIVLLYLPFLQMRLAATNRLSAVFELRAVRRDFSRAPWASAFALFITLLFALPLYLLKIEIVPREAEWLPSLVFITFIFPARLLTGWALGRARRRTVPRHWFFRWTGRLPLFPTTALYVLIVFFTQYTSWNGVWSLYEQHAFLVPVPFFGM